MSCFAVSSTMLFAAEAASGYVVVRQDVHASSKISTGNDALAPISP